MALEQQGQQQEGGEQDAVRQNQEVPQQEEVHEEVQAGDEGDGQGTGESEVGRVASEDEGAAASDPLEEMREQLAEARAENSLLQGRLLERGRGQPAAEERREPEGPNDEQIREALRTDPVNAVRGIVQGEIKRVRAEMGGEVRETNAVERAKGVDESTTFELFPELRTDKTFFNRVSQLIQLRERAQGRYVPGDYVQAASTAFAERERGAKRRQATQEPAATENNGNRREPQVARSSVQRGNPGVRSAPTSTATRATALDWGPISNPDERRMIEKNCKRWGITVEDHLKRLKSRMEQENDYGKGPILQRE